MKKVALFILLFPLLLFSSCITIYENYIFNRDGSGTMEYRVDMSELRSMMELFSDSLDMEDLNLAGTFTVSITELGALKGIGNVSDAGDAGNFIFGVRFDFENTDALNQALGLLFENNEATDTRFIDKKRRKFIRYDATSDEFSHEAMLQEGVDIDESVMKDILDKMKYSISMNFESRIRRVKSNAEYQMDGKNSVRIEANFNQMLDEEDYLETMIKTRRY